MKKTIALISALVMVFALCACGDYVNEEIAALYDAGYTDSMSTCGEESIAVLFVNEAGDSYKKMTAPVSSSQYEAYNEIDVADEDYAEQLKSFYCSFENATVEDISDRIPGDEELQQYVGMTVGELEALGFERVGYSCYEDGCEIYFENATYDCTAEIKDSGEITDLDELSGDDVRALVVESVSFTGFAWGVLEG